MKNLNCPKDIEQALLRKQAFIMQRVFENLQLDNYEPNNENKMTFRNNDLLSSKHHLKLNTNIKRKSKLMSGSFAGPEGTTPGDPLIQKKMKLPLLNNN